MKPNLGDAKVDKILSQFSQFYTNDNYISERILPVLKAKEKTGKYAKYGKENLKPYQGAIYRAPGTRAHTVDYSVSQGNYACTEKSLEKLVPDEFADNTDDPYDAKRDATAILMDNIWINQELALSTALSNTSILTQNITLSGTSKWSDKINSDPFLIIRNGIEVVRAATGQRPNLIVFGQVAFNDFRDHPDIREQLKYTNGGAPSDDATIAFIKAFFRLDEVLIGDAVYDSADLGQTAVVGDIWQDNVWLIRRTPKPTLMRASFGFTISDVPRYVDTYREDPKKSDVIRIQYSYDQLLADVQLAYLIKDTH